jgi:hypothetical protein
VSREALELVVGMALVNRRFRLHLLRSPEKALSGFDLDRQEREMILRIHEEILEDFVEELWIAIMKEG